MLVVFLGAASLSGVPALYAADVEAQNPAGFTETVELIAQIPGNALIVDESVTARPGKGIIAYVYETENGFRACMNDQCSPYVDRVARGMPVVSPDGNHFAAIVQAGGDARVMLNSRLGRAFDMVYQLCFSPDSLKLAYTAKKDEAVFVYVNKERHPAFGFIDLRLGLMFSPDSKTLVYVASIDGNLWHLVVNGEPGAAFEQIKHVTFSPDAARMTYAGKKDGKWHLVEGDDVGPGYADIKRVRFCPQSERLVYAARDDAGAFMVIDGEKLDSFDSLPGEPIFSPDGERLAYAVAEETRRRGIRMRMVVDGEVGPAFHRIGAYRFSPDGSHFAYMAVKDEKSGMMVHDGEAHEAFESIGMPVFSPQGRHLAYSAFKDKKWFVVKDGEKGPSFDTVQLEPTFSPNGERMAYEAIQGDRYLVVEDGDILGSYDLTAHLVFSPDGKHLAYTAAVEGMFFLVIDDQKGEEEFLSFLKDTPPVFTEDNIVQAIAARGYADGRQEFWLIRAEIE